MSVRPALERWMGLRPVAAALAFPTPARMTVDMVEQLDTASGHPAVLEAWLRSLDAPTFAAVIQSLCGPTLPPAPADESSAPLRGATRLRAL